MATIREVTKHGNQRFQIDLGMVSGRRVRRYTKSRKEAAVRAKEIETERAKLGDAWRDLDSREKWTILETLRDIEAAGLKITDVWKFYQQAHGSMSKLRLADAIEEWLSVKQDAGRRPKYITEAAHYLRTFAKGRESATLPSITAHQIREYIATAGKSDWGKATIKKRLNTFFVWAIQQEYCDANPVSKIETITIDKKDPEILTNDQCRRLIAAAREHKPEMLHYLALALFLGIRPEECKRLKDKDIDLDRMIVTIGADVSKIRDRRIIQINEPAYRLLSSGRLTDFATGFKKRMLNLKRLAKIKHWPHDVLRHTAASHFYNIYGIDEATKQLGHSAAIMLRHYRQMVSKEDTEAWLGI